MSEILLLMFSSRVFMVLSLTLKSLIHSEFFLMCGEEGGLVSLFCTYLFLFVTSDPFNVPALPTAATIPGDNSIV